MSEAPADEPLESDERPALLGRIRPIAAFVFGAWAVWTIFSLAYAFLDVARDMWHSIGQR